MYPITNPVTIDLVKKALYEINPEHNIIFQLMLETGIPLSECVLLTCADIDKDTLTFHPTHKHIVRSEPLSDKLQGDIAAYLNGRHDNSFAFPRKGCADEPLHPRTFLGALESVSAKLAIEPCISSQTIRKTYIYNLYVKDPNHLDKIYALTNKRGKAQVCEYLGIPCDRNEGIKFASKSSLKDVILYNETIDVTKERVDKVFDELKENIAYDKTMPYEYYREAMTLLTKINDSIETFNSEPKK